MRVTLNHVTNHLEDRQDPGFTKCGEPTDRDTKHMVYTNAKLNCKKCLPLRWKRTVQSTYQAYQQVWASLCGHHYQAKQHAMQAAAKWRQANLYAPSYITCARCNMRSR